MPKLQIGKYTLAEDYTQEELRLVNMLIQMDKEREIREEREKYERELIRSGAYDNIQYGSFNISDRD